MTTWHSNKRGLLSGLWDLLVVKSKREGAFFEGQHNIMKTVRWGMSKEIQRNNSFAAFSATKKSGRSAKTRSRSKSADPEQSKKETNEKKPSSILKENAEMLGQLAQVFYFDFTRAGAQRVTMSMCLSSTSFPRAFNHCSDFQAVLSALTSHLAFSQLWDITHQTDGA